GVVEPRLQRVLQRRDQAVDRLALVLGDLRERLAGLEPVADLALGEAEVRRRGRETGEAEVSELAEVMAEAEKRRSYEGDAGRVDALLQRVAFRLRQTARGYFRVNVVLERLLERVRQLERLHAELPRSVADHGLALVARRAPHPRGGDPGAGPSDCERCGGSD